MSRWLLVALAVVLAGCQGGSGEPLRVGSNTWLGYEPLYLARDEGLLDPGQVRLVEMVTAADVMHAFRGGLLEGAALTLDEALTLLAEGFDLRLVLAFDYSDGADGLVARPGIDSLEGLRGRRVGFESNAVGAVVLEAALQAASLGAWDIQPVALAANEQAAAFREGRVDAVVTFEPLLGRLVREQGGRLLFDSRRIPERIVDVLVVRGDVYRERRRAVRGLLHGWFEALERMARAPAASAERMGARHGLAAEEVLHDLRGIRLLDREGNRKLLLGKSPALVDSARSLAEIMVHSGLLARQPPLAGVVGAAPLEGL